MFPEFPLGVITVTVEYRGAAPEEVEDAVCLRVEEALQGVDGIKQTTSEANEGRASVTLEILAGYDVHKVLDEVEANVDTIETFPEEVEKPLVQELTTGAQVINVAVAGEAELATLKRIGETVRDDLTALLEISQAKLLNAPHYEVSIEVSEEALHRWGLSFDIVVGEYICTTQTRTGNGTSAAIHGTHEVGVLTTMAAFSTMLFVPGIMVKIMGVFPLTILPTLFFSLVEANLILPSHLSQDKRPRREASPNLVVRPWNAFFDLFPNGLA